MNAKFQEMKARAAARDAKIMARRAELIEAGEHPGAAYLQALAETSQKEQTNVNSSKQSA